MPPFGPSVYEFTADPNFTLVEPAPASAEPLLLALKPPGPASVPVFTGIAVKPLGPRNVASTFKPKFAPTKRTVPTDISKTAGVGENVTGGGTLVADVVQPASSSIEESAAMALAICFLITAPS
jgi:hypothetical protein